MLSSSTSACTAVSLSMKCSSKLFPSRLCEDGFICVENPPGRAQHRLVAHQLLDIISKLTSATTSYASRASPTPAAPTVRASSAAQLANLTSSCTHCGCKLCDALTHHRKTTAHEKSVTSPALITISRTRHGEKGTPLQNCASDSLTSRWRFFAVRVFVVLLILASLCRTRWSFH